MMINNNHDNINNNNSNNDNIHDGNDDNDNNFEYICYLTQIHVLWHKANANFISSL